MFRIKTFLKRYKKAVATILTGAALLTLFLILNSVGNAWRGYDGIGGELLVFVLPLLIIVFRDGLHDFIDRMK